MRNVITVTAEDGKKNICFIPVALTFDSDKSQFVFLLYHVLVKTRTNFGYNPLSNIVLER